jgi:hypothetical protein
MSLLKLGKVWLGTKGMSGFSADAQFDTDPKIQRDWPIRRSAFENVGGGVTHQDFGRYAADLRLQLASDGNFMGHPMKTYIDGLAAARGAAYDYKDYTGIEATVVIMEWQPRVTFIKDGRGVLWEYQMTLQVLDLAVLDFETYEFEEEDS